MEARTPLQRDLAARILEMARADGLGAGAQLNESATARRLEVSRSPIRAAFAQLAERGLVRRLPGRGIELVGPPGPDAAHVDSPSELEAVLVRLAHDREAGDLGYEFSEQEILRRYALTRPQGRRLLMRLADLEVVARKPGYGWRFLHPANDPGAVQERYRFRLMIEPAALLEPGFRLDPAWAADMRARHGRMLTQPWHDSAAVAFFEMNADFHEGLAAASGNRFVQSAVRRQNQSRRLSNWRWGFGVERVEVTCREHLEILDFLDRGDREVASALMRRHLERASALPPSP